MNKMKYVFFFALIFSAAFSSASDLRSEFNSQKESQSQGIHLENLKSFLKKSVYDFQEGQNIDGETYIRLSRNQEVCQVQRIDQSFDPSFMPLPGSAAPVVQITCKNGKAVIYEDGLVQPRR